MAPIINDILDDISDRLDGLSVDTGYNLNWGSSNIEDEAKIRWSSDLECSGAVSALSEENTDATEGGDSFSYANTLFITIKVKAPLDAVSKGKLGYEVSKRYALALDDLKKAFKGHDVGVDPAEYYLGYRRMEFIVNTTQSQEYMSDRLLPKYMRVTFELEYTQDRDNPELPGDM